MIKKIMVAGLMSAYMAPALAVEDSYSPYADDKVPRTAYWGDTHLHTNFSPDAALLGNRALGPDQAYRLASGEVVTAHNGMPVRLIRPLDFLVVSDHAEYLGLLPMLRAEEPTLMKDSAARRWAKMLKGGDESAQTAFLELLEDIGTATARIDNPDINRTAWHTITATADQFNQPGQFTTFSGYEWTSMPGGNNLHRVVIFKDGVDKVNQILPFSAYDSEDPEDLWSFLADYEKNTGGNVLAIAHNGNISNGTMFALQGVDGGALSKNYAQTRSRWEPLYEVTQIKGDGETHPRLSPEDEFADFERWDKGNLDGTAAKTPQMLPFEYARSALKMGLSQQAKLGVNPFKFGMIGSSDAHTSLPAVREDNFWGKMSSYEPAPGRAIHQGYIKGERGKVIDLTSWEFSASGYAAVWATDNTREALFAAMKRKETFATTGPRMTVRFFGGWEFSENDLEAPDYVISAYRKGVPMGGDLPQSGEISAPQFLVVAAKDPDGANLDRIQIIKGWLDDTGSTHEKVYNVAVSDQRKIKRNKVKPLKSTVDKARYDNSIGDAILSTVWTDPEFDSSQQAFYYARVIEIPTPRWTAYDAAYFDVEMPDEVPKAQQERAYTSPIWYNPKP